MNFFRRILGGIKLSYLIRSYMIGLIFFVLIIGTSMSFESENGTPIAGVVLALLATLLFPFAKLVWDELRDLVFGNNVIFMNAILLFMIKWIVNTFLWAFSIFIAPFGLLYLWFRTREPKEAVEE